MLKYWFVLRQIQILVDFLLVFGSFILAYFLRVGFIFSSDFPFWLYLILGGLASGVWIFFLMFTKYYSIPPRSGGEYIYDFVLLFAGGVLANSFLIVTYFFPREILFSRLISLYAFLGGCVFLLLSQSVVRFMARRAKQKQNRQVYRTLIIGSNKVAINFIKAVKEDPLALYQVLGVIDPYGVYTEIEGSSVLGKLDRLDDICRKEKINAIIQCDAFEHTINILSFCESNNIKYQFTPALRGVFEKNLRIRKVAGQTMISFVKRDFKSKNKKQVYRVFDIVLNQIFGID